MKMVVFCPFCQKRRAVSQFDYVTGSVEGFLFPPLLTVTIKAPKNLICNKCIKGVWERIKKTNIFGIREGHE